MRCLLVRDVAFLRHERQDDGHALGAGLGVIDGIIGRRRLRKSCKHGALGKVELLRLLAKVRVAGFPEAVCPVTEVNGIEVELKDFLPPSYLPEYLWLQHFLHQSHIFALLSLPVK